MSHISDNIYPTFTVPHGFNDVMLHTEDDGSNDDGGQGGLGYKGRVGHQESEAEQDQDAGVEATHGGPHPAGAVDRRPRKGPGDGHRLDKAGGDVAHAKGEHLL